METEVCVVGAGAAGITVALELEKKGNEVLLIESGGLEFEARAQALYQGEARGQFPPGSDYLSTSRLRYFGGTTNLWGGRCRPLDAVDFEERQWIPTSGWPITRMDLQPYYNIAAELCEIDPFSESNQSSLQPHEAPDGSPFTRLRKVAFHYSPPTRFGLRYRSQIARSSRLRVLLNQNAVELKCEPDARSIAKIVFRALGGHTLEVSAKYFVLACGAIENARLLLASNSGLSAGVGNARGLVGRYYMEHPEMDLGLVALSTRDSSLEIRALNSRGAAKRVVNYLSPDQSLQRSRQLANFSVDLASSGVVEAPGTLRAVAETLLRVSTDTFGGKPAFHRLILKTEQMPNSSSRVSLAHSKDALDRPRALLDWRLSPLDYGNLCAGFKLVAEELGSTRLGRAWFRPSAEVLRNPDALGERILGKVKGTHHQMGTTRMADSPSKGVVDKDCKVFGIDNLYVAGGSVFPTSGYANPTLTIVALAARLAAHLSEALA